MQIYNIEPSGFKTWMIANMKIWGFLPIIPIWFIASLFILKINPNANTDLIGYGLFAAIFSSMLFAAAQEVGKGTVVCYTFIFGLPLILLLGEFDTISLTTGMKIYLWICFGISVFIGSIFGVYGYQNADEMYSKLFVLNSSAKELFETDLSIAYMRFVEAYLFTFIGFAVIAPLFS
ncbi:MAG: hypothetical protein K2K27_02435 [Muribaculaceae bacterium]|nr:hypothetical protein [Muribaculaceae bacterium]MDE6642938.1 hypothetical protein [Muribaculaceae bacterium]